MATKNVNIDIIAKDKTRQAMQSATKGVNDLKDNVKRSVSAQTNSFNALGSTIKTVIGGVVAFQALRFSQQMVMMASSVEEMQSKSSVVFGRFVSSVRKDLEKFGLTTPHQVGVNLNTLKPIFKPYEEPAPIVVVPEDKTRFQESRETAEEQQTLNVDFMIAIGKLKPDSKFRGYFVEKESEREFRERNKEVYEELEQKYPRAFIEPVTFAQMNPEEAKEILNIINNLQ